SSRAHGYIPHMLHSVRGHLALRAIALVTAVSLKATSGGLPMCLSALTQAVAHCAMHGEGHHQDGHAVSLSLQLVAANGSQSCHPDADGLGCSGARVCPAVGPAVPAGADLPMAVRSVSRAAAPASAASLLSYLAPPLAPPPQARAASLGAVRSRRARVACPRLRVGG